MRVRLALIRGRQEERSGGAELVHDGVGAKDLGGDLAAQEGLLLVLADGGHVARPQVKLVVLQPDVGLRKKEKNNYLLDAK